MKKKQRGKEQKNQKRVKDNQRKYLSADAMFAQLKNNFSKIPEHRQGDIRIPLSDAMMSAFAMFSLKDSSLLAFDERRESDPINLRTIYNIDKIPCDTQMRKILDDVDPEYIRSSYKTIFNNLQRGKALEPMVFMEEYYLASIDGTGHFSSKKIHSQSCMEKISKKTGEITYYQQMLGAVIVHPNLKEVIPLLPEPIIKQDGQKKNDCERNAAKRLLEKIKKEHPKLKLIITEDGLSSNAPHIKDIQQRGWRYILGAKEGDHTFLFNHVADSQKKGEVTEFEIIEGKIIHKFRYLNQVPLNESNQDVLVNFIEYWEILPEKTQHFSWVTDFTITQENAYKLMKGGRSRWKIENETFNVLKNQGYHFGHNYGLGKNNLSSIFTILMMLAFLVDQTQQLCCQLFQSVKKKLKTKRALWERIRSFFNDFQVESMEMIYKALLYGHQKSAPIILNTS